MKKHYTRFIPFGWNCIYFHSVEMVIFLSYIQRISQYSFSIKGAMKYSYVHCIFHVHAAPPSCLIKCWICPNWLNKHFINEQAFICIFRQLIHPECYQVNESIKIMSSDIDVLMFKQLKYWLNLLQKKNIYNKKQLRKNNNNYRLLNWTKLLKKRIKVYHELSIATHEF